MTELRLEALRKDYGDGPALDGLDLTVRSGELMALLGPSGCGKTTTLRLIAGLETPDAGAVRLDGRDMAGVEPRRRGMGMVFQRYALFPHMTVAANVAFGLRVRRLPAAEVDDRVAAMLDVVQLRPLAARYPAQLSGGQMQRVAIARTLVTEPAVLMLDEPLANLDTGLRAEMRAFLRGLQRRLGLTTILVTHDQAEAMEMADRVAVMLGGRLAQLDAPEGVWARPATRAVAAFMGATNVVPGTLAAPDRLDTALGPLPVAPRAGLAPGARVHAVLRAEALTLHAAPPAGPALAATVAERAFHGATASHVLDAGGARLTATGPAATNHAPGTPVWATIPPDRVWLMTDRSPE